jgi:hypothetical protein
MRDAQASAFAANYLVSRGNGGLFFTSDACSWSCSSQDNPLLANLFSALRYSCKNDLKQLGLDVPDDQYFAEATAAFGGRLMQIPPELVAAAVGNATIEGLKQVLDRHQWKYLGLRPFSWRVFPAVL